MSEGEIIDFIEKTLVKISDVKNGDIGDNYHNNLYKNKALSALVNLKKLNNKNTDMIYETGVYYGFPKCCILEFIEDYFKVNSNLKNRVIDNRGFIPCTKHFTNIKSKKISIDELITNRVCQESF